MSNAHEPLVSKLADDEDMIDLVRDFVDELPRRAEAVQQAFEQHDLEQVRCLAHQLKGAAGGYGFQPISDTAAALEDSVQQQARVEDITRQVQELAQICRRARAN